MTSPPLPPLAPSGPPSGLNFSRCTDAQPCPPLPAAMCRTTRSTKSATGSPSGDPGGFPGTEGFRELPRRPLQQARADRDRSALGTTGSGRAGFRPRRALLRDRDDAHGPAATVAAELHGARDQREQGVVLAEAHV